jgi:AcrR family transcriptional regulator
VRTLQHGGTAIRSSHEPKEDGPDALTMRRIAAEAGSSTTVLYTMFGGKAGIAEAL